MQTVFNVMGDAYGAGLINHLSTDPENLLEDHVVINNCNVDENRFQVKENGTTSTTTL